MEKENLMKRIINHCEKYKIKRSFNNPCGKHLVSFEIKEVEENE